VDDKKYDRNRDARVGDVEGGPRVRVGKMQIEKKEIDHVPIKKAIGEISKNSGKQERKRHIAPGISWMSSHEQSHNDEKGYG
jgi:hypothetical protein